MAANRPPISYNKPNRLQALLEIRRLIVEEGLSHNEIQLRLNIPARTYFNWLDLLFRAEQEAIQGDHYTYQRLLNETLILNQRYLRRARKLTEIGDDKTVDAEQRIEAHKFAAQMERAVHDMSYLGPAYLKNQNLLPDIKSNNNPSLPGLTMSAIDDEDFEQKDPPELERGRILAAGEYRREQQQQQKNKKIISSSSSTTNPLAYTEDTYDKVQKNKKKLEEEEQRWR